MCECSECKQMSGKMKIQIENWCPRVVDALLNMSRLHFAFSQKVYSVSEYYAIMRPKQR